MKNIILILFTVCMIVLFLNTDISHQIQDLTSPYKREMFYKDLFRQSESVEIRDIGIDSSPTIQISAIHDTAVSVRAMIKPQEYIKKYAPIAQQVSKEYGVPASVELATGILEGTYGNSTLAVQASNHHGIKCREKFKCPASHCMNRQDDHPNDYFLKFTNGEASYFYHGKMVTSGRYQHIKKVAGKDPERWVEELKHAGYATSSEWVKNMKRVIKDYNLKSYDL